MFKTILVAATLVLAALPVQAAVMQAVYTGTIQSNYNVDSYDHSGMFGSVGSLDGLGVTVAFTYDTNGGVRVTDGIFDAACGGTYYRAPTMILAQISIAGHTATFPGNTFGCASIYTPRTGGYAIFQDTVAHSDLSSPAQANYSYVSAAAYYVLAGLRPSLDTPYNFDAAKQLGSTSFFGFMHFDGTSYQVQARGAFYINHLTISAGDPTTEFPSDPVVPEVPLPASSGMGIAALAGLVLMARRRRAA